MIPILAFGIGFALGVIAGLSLIYNQPPPRPLPWREPYDGEAIGV